MRKKLIIITISLFAVLLIATPAFAYYSAVKGELRNSLDNALWTHGATVEIFDCTTFATITTQTVDASGTFNIPINPASSTRTLCIEVDFTPAPGGGDPGNAAKGPYLDRASSTGTLDTGVYFTGTGPTAITLQQADAGNVSSALPLVGLALLLLGGVTYVVLRRKAIA